MTLSELLKSDLIHLKIKCASKNELISELLKQIYDIGQEPPFSYEEVLKKIHMREEIGGTLLPSGLSVPHARLKDYEGFVLALGIPSEPIFQDEIQIRMMSLMITSQSGGPYYLPTLANLTKMSRDGEYFSWLCGSVSREIFLSRLRERDIEFS